MSRFLAARTASDRDHQGLNCELAMTIKVVYTPQSRLAGSPLELLRRESLSKWNGDGVAMSVYHSKDCA